MQEKMLTKDPWTVRHGFIKSLDSEMGFFAGGYQCACAVCPTTHTLAGEHHGVTARFLFMPHLNETIQNSTSGVTVSHPWIVSDSLVMANTVAHVSNMSHSHSTSHSPFAVPAKVTPSSLHRSHKSCTGMTLRPAPRVQISSRSSHRFLPVDPVAYATGSHATRSTW